MISIVIPAYNEEAVIAQCLEALTADRAREGEIEVIVACNGCKDRTAEIAASFGPPVRVVSTDEASKVAALNLADAVATGFPRLYVDADVVLPLSEVRKLAAALEREGKLAGSPRVQMDLRGASVLVAAFYAVWQRMAFHKHGMIGCGVYALAQQGRARFGRFPEVIADDEFVRRQFQPSERVRVSDCVVTVRAPTRLSDLIKIKSRSRLGRRQLDALFPQKVEHAQHDVSFVWGPIACRPWLWPCVPVYLAVNIAAMFRAMRQMDSIDQYQWERDESSRRAVGAAGS